MNFTELLLFHLAETTAERDQARRELAETKNEIGVLSATLEELAANVGSPSAAKSRKKT